jgi:tetratricopeptide (TPR) repeat protein
MYKAALAMILLLFVAASFSGVLVSPLAHLMFLVLATLLLLLLLLADHQGRATCRLPPGFLPILLLIVFGLFQLLPLPPGLVRLIAAKNWHIYQETVGILEPGAWIPLTLGPKQTLFSIFQLFSMAAAYLGVASLLEDRNKLKAVSIFLVFGGGVLSCGLLVLGLLIHVFPLLSPENSGPAYFWSIVVTTSVPVLAMTCPLSLALFLADRPTALYGTRKERTTEFFAAPLRQSYLLYGWCGILMSVAIALFIPAVMPGILVAVLAFGLLLGLRLRARQEWPYILVYLILILFLALFTSRGATWPTTGEKGGEGQFVNVRADGSAARFFTDFSIMGSGFGTYEIISQRYNILPGTGEMQRFQAKGIFRLTSEIGVLGMIAVFWLVISLLLSTYPNWRQRRHKISIYLYAGGISAFLALVFGFCFGALPGRSGLAMLAILFGGMTVAASGASQPVEQEGPSPKLEARFCPPKQICFLIAGLGAGILFLFGEVTARQLYTPDRTLQTAASEEVEGGAALNRHLKWAVAFDPLNPVYRYALGRQFLVSGEIERAIASFVSAVRLNPMAGEEIYTVGQVFLNQGEVEKAEGLFRAALRNDPSNRKMQLGFVSRLLMENKFGEALSSIRSFLELAPEEIFFWLEFIASKGIAESEFSRMVPRRARSHLDYAQYLEQVGRPGEAENFYRSALFLARKEPLPGKELFSQIAAFFEKQRLFPDALEVMQAAADQYPREVEFLLATGRYYRELKLPFKAVETYQKVLVIDPGNQEAQAQLRRLEAGI